jgi:hypothetical protein
MGKPAHRVRVKQDGIARRKTGFDNSCQYCGTGDIMETWLIVLCLILFPTATVTILAIVAVAVLGAMCWPLLPILAFFGAVLSAMSRGIKS